MARAVRLSRRGLPAPNPHVGCVLVRDGIAVGEGWHRFAGGLHAEAMALDQAKEGARGAEAFVTLEPCHHQGRQPPCTAALIKAGIQKVWYAIADPNPLVSGGGAEALRMEGIKVEEGLLAAEAAHENRSWLLAMKRRRPFVTLKVAMSMDGRVALPNGESQWITGEAARRAGRRLRAEMGAVLVGRGTVEADDPRLTARISRHPVEPVRIVLDPHRKLVDHHAVFRGVSPALRVVAESNAQSGDLEIPLLNGQFDLIRLMIELWNRGLTGVLVEGGAKTAATFLELGLADRLELFVGNVVLGSGPVWMDSPLHDSLNSAPRWKLQFAKRMGDDVWMRFEPQNSETGRLKA